MVADFDSQSNWIWNQLTDKLLTHLFRNLDAPSSGSPDKRRSKRKTLCMISVYLTTILSTLLLLLVLFLAHNRIWIFSGFQHALKVSGSAGNLQELNTRLGLLRHIVFRTKLLGS